MSVAYFWYDDQRHLNLKNKMTFDCCNVLATRMAIKQKAGSKGIIFRTSFLLLRYFNYLNQQKQLGQHAISPGLNLVR